MKKIHTQLKRRFGLSTHNNQYDFFHPKEIPHRPKTFKTEESAHAAASKNGLKQGEYSLKKVKKNKKFQIVKKL
ncbi:MAG: hypothetical protein KKC75_06550 [Nanoarchaeota archaeon]|nr:hypothetical protein [Nanoarchaeota archaeon]MBU1005513.1 hypothetical protein [Nanoarchaeota archaeon]MBU1945852.1 hypothetical protein [Nanoarchaeota archaeon]